MAPEAWNLCQPTSPGEMEVQTVESDAKTENPIAVNGSPGCTEARIVVLRTGALKVAVTSAGSYVILFESALKRVNWTICV